MSQAAGQLRARLPRFNDAASLRERLALVPPRMSEAPRTPFVVLVCTMLAAGVVGLLMFNTHLQQGAFTVRNLQKQADALTAQRQQLTMELQRLRDPQRIASQAHDLGMVAAVNPVFLNAATGQIIGTPKAATPKDALQVAYDAPKPAELQPAPQIVTVPAQTPPAPAPVQPQTQAPAGAASAAPAH